MGLEVEFSRYEGVLRMKKSRFTDSQISEALKRVEAGLAVPEICRELGVSTATFYKWRAKYGGMCSLPRQVDSPMGDISAGLGCCQF